MLKPVFKNIKHEQEINEFGFVVIQNFISEQELKDLTNIYNQFHKEREIGCWNSIYDLPVGTGKLISEKINDIISQKIESIFEDASFPSSIFISKNPNAGHESLVHRDDTLHNEKEAEYRQCWIPLVDTNINNGALYVVPKSHKIFTNERPMFSKWRYTELNEKLKQYFQILEMKAGDMVVYFDKTLHGSNFNSTDKPRPVIQGGVIHKDAPMYFTKLDNETNLVMRYKVDSDFFFNKEFLNNNINEKYKLIDKYKLEEKIISEQEIDRLFKL